MNSRKTVVIGAGISGLSCATRLVEAGYSVRIWSADDPLHTVSAIAAALWYPYRAFPIDRVRRWSARGLAVFRQQAASGVPGIRLANGRLLWRGARPAAIDDIPAAAALSRSTLSADYAGGAEVVLPVIEMPVYLKWLVSALGKNGVFIEARSIASLNEITDAELVINCAGLGARTLCGDLAMVPVRGQVVRVENDGLTDFVVDVDAAHGATYVIPRALDCVLGGTAEDGNSNAEPDPRTSEQIVARCTALEPRVAPLRHLGTGVGLRPGRAAVRLDREQLGATRVIHNYGHGGAGVTMAWGCAEEVLALARS